MAYAILILYFQPLPVWNASIVLSVIHSTIYGGVYMRPAAYRAKINGDLAQLAIKRATLDRRRQTFTQQLDQQEQQIVSRETILRSELARIDAAELRATQYPEQIGPFVVCKDNKRHVPEYLNASYTFELTGTPRIFKQAKRANDAARATGGYVMAAPVWALRQDV
jgi:hypothetical protein